MAAADSFVHLHLHTEYSLLDGAVRIPELMKKANEFGMPAVAMTDHGVMYGAVEFYQEAEKAGIKPIIGCEVYMAPGKLTDRTATGPRDAATHFTLLAKDAEGYANLVKLVSIANLEGVYYKPRIDKEVLAQHAKGLIGLSGCLKGEINQHLLQEQMAKARASMAEYRDILGAENFYVEMHDHGIETQTKVNRILPGLAREFGLPLVAANDVHFLERAHHEAHDVMICIGTGANVTDEKRMHYVPEIYFKSPAEMRELFREHPEACDNTLRIAERCDFKMEFGVPKYPNYTPPEGLTQNAYLREICARGVRDRFGAEADSAVIQERMERELALLETQGFVNYFLIVWDFIAWARARGIPVGPGRGSAAGSLVAYVMQITDIDPLKFKLLFERFLNPERVSPPDIDVDFCQNRRGEVIDYVKQKYGERAVSQIITFGTLGAKSVVRDVARVLGWSYGDGDRLAKMIPNELNISLNGFDTKNKETGEKMHVGGAIDKNPDLKHAVETEPATAQLWSYAKVLEGISRNAGVHAAGVVIGGCDLSEYIPLARSNDGGIVSQYSMQPLTDLGMLKMDFLGLKTLTVIDDAVKLILRGQPDFDLKKIPLDDQASFDLIHRGETVALFQLESGGMVNVCRQIPIKDIEDINAIIALYRPGPMELIPDYIKRKNGGKIKYAHPLLEKVCAETYGIFVYQEQVMQAAQVLAGYTLGGADLLRRAMGKKDKEKMAKEREKFVAGCAELNGIEAKKANEIFDLLEKFAGYGFNRSHSAAYAWVSYQTAYLKANFPVEFMSAVMSNEVSNTDKIAIFVNECQRMGMAILPPDVNRSGLTFLPEMSHRGHREHGAGEENLEAKTSENSVSSVAENRGIRYGLAAIKNVGEAAMAAAILEREASGPFKSLADFCARLDARTVGKKVLESLVKCGAFDWTGIERAELFESIDSTLQSSAHAHRDRAAGQVSLFDLLEEAPPSRPVKTARVEPWPLFEKLTAEKELLGFYVTGHPLDEYRSVLEKYVPIAALAEQEDKATVQVAGALSIVDKRFTKKDGKPFAIVTLEDMTGSVEVMIWNEAFTKVAAHLEQGRVVAVTARLDRRDEAPRLVANEVKPLKAGPPVAKIAPPLVLKFPLGSTTEADLLAVSAMLRAHPGSELLEMVFTGDNGQKIRLRPTNGDYRVEASDELRKALSAWL